MPPKAYTIHFRDSVPLKERGKISKLLEENGTMFAVLPGTGTSGSPLIPPIPGIGAIQVTDEYGTFECFVKDMLPNWCYVTAP